MTSFRSSKNKDLPRIAVHESETQTVFVELNLVMLTIVSVFAQVFKFLFDRSQFSCFFSVVKNKRRLFPRIISGKFIIAK
jgi:hypothetical protein